MLREEFKVIKLQDREFKIHRMNALAGSYLVYQLMGSMLPGGMDKSVTAGKAPSDRKKMSREEFTEIQGECLKVCTETLKAGDTPIINPNGSFGVSDIETNLTLVLALTVNALVFNISCFFEGNALKELTDSFQGLRLSNAKM